MRLNFGKIFQEKTKDHSMNGSVKIPADINLWPKSWLKIHYKDYKRFKSVKLPTPIPKDFGHIELVKRKTLRDFKKGGDKKSASLQEISNILYYSCGELEKKVDEDRERRVYPSAGSRYPVEVYILNFKKGDLEESCFHYNVRENSLEELWSTDIKDKKEISVYFNYEWSVEATFAIVLTGVTTRVFEKYGERGYKYMYMETGAILNNLQVNSMLEGRGGVIMGGLKEDHLEDLLDLDGEKEVVISAILIN